MTITENIDVVMLIVAIVLVLIIFTLSLVQTIRGKRTLIGPITIILLIIGVSLLIPITFNASEIETAEWVQIILMIGLVAVTAVYAFSATRQADASVKMAEEVKSQRRPIVVPKAFPAEGVPLEATAEEITEYRYSDYFKIYNKGNSPAINLEVLLLNHGKSQCGCLKETVFSQGDKPLEFHPSGLSNHLQSTCYLVCRYCSVLSTKERQIWYETWLPFIPNKSQRGDLIIIVPKELEFREVFEKKSY